MELESLNTTNDEINKLKIELEVSAVLKRKLKRFLCERRCGCRQVGLPGL